MTDWRYNENQNAAQDSALPVIPRLRAHLLVISLFCSWTTLAGKAEDFDYHAVETAIRAGHFQEARTVLTARLYRSPADGYAHLLFGIVLGELEETTGAEGQFHEAIRLRPRDPAPQTNLGNLLARRGQLAEAARRFEAALALNPLDPTCLSDLGSVQMSMKQYRAAMNSFEAASRIAPNDVGILLGLFQAQLKLGRVAPSEASAERLLALPAIDEQAIQIIGTLEGESGRYASAVRTFEKGALLFPGSLTLPFNLGLALQKSGDAHRAASILEALRSKNDTAELEDVLGGVHEQNGEFLAAVQSFQRAAEMEPSQESYRFNYTSELLAHLNFEAALLVAQRAVHDFPQSVRINVALGVALFGLARFQKAEELFLELARRFPDSDLPLVYISLSEEANETQIPGSRELLKSFHRRHPSNFMAPYLLGRAAFRDGDAATAASLLTTSIGLHSDYAPAHFELGRALAELGRTNEAVAQYRAALKLDSTKAETWYRLTIAYRKLHQTKLADEAEAEFHNFQSTTGKPELVQTFVYTINSK